MKIGDTVKFIDGLYEDEKGAIYKVVEINGDRATIEFICDLPIPPQSIAKTGELEVIQLPDNEQESDVINYKQSN